VDLLLSLAHVSFVFLRVQGIDTNKGLRVLDDVALAKEIKKSMYDPAREVHVGEPSEPKARL
jgi:hypothetical protein